jgi:hypothetical protein
MRKRAARAPVAGGGFVAPETFDAISGMNAGQFLLLPGAFRDLDARAARAHVNMRPDMRFAREASRNQVGFGQLVVADPDHRARVEYIAMKPYETPQHAANEFGAMSAVNALARQGKLSPSLQPLGFYRRPEDGSVAMMTRYEHSVLTLDNLFWDPNFAPSERQMRAALGHCALSLGELHYNGIAHVDAQVKNIAADNQGNRYVDLEDSREFALRDSILDPNVVGQLLEVDVRDCLESLNGHGVDLIDESFTPAYLDIVSMPGSAVPTESMLDSEAISHMTW